MADFGNNTVFSQTDASNNSGTVPTYAEGMAPSQVNDSSRALQGAAKRDWDRRNPTISSTGTAPAYVLTYTVAPAALYNGERYAFEANFTNTSTDSTLNINGLGAKGIRIHNGGNLYTLPPNTIYVNDHVEVIYDLSQDVFILQSPPSSREFLVKKTATETVNNSVAMQNDDDLFFAVSANIDYEFEFILFTSTDPAADIKVQLTGPAAPTLVFTAVTYHHANIDATDSATQTTTAFSSVTSHKSTAGLVGMLKITGTLHNGANAGTVRLQWAQNTANASDTTIRKGSTVRYSVIP